MNEGLIKLTRAQTKQVHAKWMVDGRKFGLILGQVHTSAFGAFGRAVERGSFRYTILDPTEALEIQKVLHRIIKKRAAKKAKANP